jgi:hypothetical protein
MPIRTVESIDAEIYQLSQDVEARGAAVDWQEARIDSDEFDAGRVELRNMPRGSDGRLPVADIDAERIHLYHGRSA